MIKFPALTKVDRGDHEGLIQIVLSDEMSWEEAQEFAQQLISKFGMNLIRKTDGPDAWLWYVEYQGKNLIISYDDFPCETVIIADSNNDEYALKKLFSEIMGEEET